MKILVTGGAGFIGTTLIQKILQDSRHHVHNLDKLTYASNVEAHQALTANNCYKLSQVDICNRQLIDKIIQEFQPNAILHLAAESHVDRSINGATPFIETNILGTYTLLEASLNYWRNQNKPDHFKFIHISTDEVYGSLQPDDPEFTESTPYSPNSPYSASKAASDHLVRAWHVTHGLPVIITHCSNNYGPHQHPEKFIPVVILNAFKSAPIPVYGKGLNIRDWIYVEDHVNGLLTILQKGKPGEVYNMGGNCEIRNIDLAEIICKILDGIEPRDDRKSYQDQIQYVTDRPGHDFRYAISNEKISTELGWNPKTSLKEGLTQTIHWYLQNYCHEGNYISRR